MSDPAQYTFDAGQFMSQAAKNYALLAGDAALAAGTTVRVFAAVAGTGALGFNVIIEVTLNNEPLDQAILSQIAAAAAGVAGIAVATTAGLPLVGIALSGAAASYFGNQLADWLYQMWKERNGVSPNIILPAINNLFSGARTWLPPVGRDPLVLDLDRDGIETIGANGTVLFDHDGDGLKTGTGWVGLDDGLLVLDRNDNGQIDTGAAEAYGDVGKLCKLSV